MKLPSWFRLAWWAAMLLVFGFVVAKRLPEYTRETATTADLAVLGVLIALLMVPIFGEISIFGVSLKQSVEGLKNEVAGLRTEVRNSIAVNTHISPILYMPEAPPDTQLPAIEERTLSAVSELLTGAGAQSDLGALKPLDDNLAIFFNARYRIEAELRRIWAAFSAGDPQSKTLPTLRIANSLAQEGVIGWELAAVLRDVYRVVSPAVHGEPITEAQVDFVQRTAPGVIAVLEGISPGSPSA